MTVNSICWTSLPQFMTSCTYEEGQESFTIVLLIWKMAWRILCTFLRNCPLKLWKNHWKWSIDKKSFHITVLNFIYNWIRRPPLISSFFSLSGHSHMPRYGYTPLWKGYRKWEYRQGKSLNSLYTSIWYTDCKWKKWTDRNSTFTVTL